MVTQPSSADGVRKSTRAKKKPSYLNDYVTDDDDQVFTNIDYCYRLACDVPQSFKEAKS